MKQLILLSLLVGVSFAQTNPVQTSTVATGFAVSLPATLPSLAAGNTLIAVAAVATGAGYTDFTLADSANGAWNPTNCGVIKTAGARQAKACWFPNSAASAGTYTLTETPTGGSGSVGLEIVVQAYSGSPAVSPLDGSVPTSLGYTSGVSFPVPSLTTTVPVDIVFSWVVTGGAPNFTVNGGFVPRTTLTATPIAVADFITSTTGTFAPTWVAGASQTSVVTGALALKGNGAFNCVTNNSCPATALGTPGSTTWRPIGNTAFTSLGGISFTSVDSLYSFKFDSLVTACPSGYVIVFNPGQCIMGVFAPHGVSTASLLWVECWHGGGGFGGDGENCFGLPPGVTNANAATTPIGLVQQYADYPNPQGGKGIGVIEFDYTLSSQSGGATVLPQQYQDLFCGESFVMTGALGFTPTLPLGRYGPSWGGTLVVTLSTAPTSVYGASPTCLATDTRASSARAVAGWPIMSMALPAGASSYENNASGEVQTAVDDFLHCSSGPTCAALDLSLNASPYAQIKSANLAQIKSTAIMYQFNVGDTIVTPYWSSNTQGNLVYTLNAYAALGIFPPVVVYPNCGTQYNNCNSTGGHESGLGNIGVWSMQDAFEFLLGGAAGANSGVIR